MRTFGQQFPIRLYIEFVEMFKFKFIGVVAMYNLVIISTLFFTTMLGAYEQQSYAQNDMHNRSQSAEAIVDQSTGLKNLRQYDNLFLQQKLVLILELIESGKIAIPFAKNNLISMMGQIQNTQEALCKLSWFIEHMTKLCDVDGRERMDDLIQMRMKNNLAQKLNCSIVTIN
jgi:hypothetical protein